MPALHKMTRTDISAIISVVLFGFTILISAVGPAQAEGTMAAHETASPTVSFNNLGYRA